MTENIHVTWERIKKGNAQSWKELVRLHADLVFRVAKKVGLTDSDAEDCSQHTWIALYKNRHKINDPTVLVAWLIRTSHRKALEIAKRYNRQLQLKDIDEPYARGPLPDEIVDQLEMEAVISNALKLIDPRCRQLLTYLYFTDKDVPYSEIAKKMKIKANSLGPLRSRCLEKLKKILEKLGYFLD